MPRFHYYAYVPLVQVEIHHDIAFSFSFKSHQKMKNTPKMECNSKPSGTHSKEKNEINQRPKDSFRVFPVLPQTTMSYRVILCHSFCHLSNLLEFQCLWSVGKRKYLNLYYDGKMNIISISKSIWCKHS